MPRKVPRPWFASILAATLAAGAVAAIHSGERALTVLRASAEASRLERSERFPLVVIDPSGPRFTLESAPRRIASVSVAADEIVSALAGTGALVAVSSFADDPLVSQTAGLVPDDLPRLAGEAESILRVRPDLAVVSGYARAATVSMLSASGVPVFRLGRARDWSDIEHQIRDLGALLDRRDRAEALVASMNETLSRARARAAGHPPVRTLFVSWSRYTAGEDTLIGAVLRTAGCENVVRDTGLRGAAPISLELAVALQPDALVTVVASDDVDPRATFENDPRWSVLPAVREGRILALPGSLILSTSHHAARAAEEIAVWLDESRS